MEKIIGIRFKSAGKIYNFNCGAYVLNTGDAVIVETENGLCFGRVAVAPVEKANSGNGEALKKVYRPATESDLKQVVQNRELENQAFEYCKQCIAELGLDMNLFTIESNFDTSKLTFYFTADGRVDFRRLVKMLVKEFRTKIEMRQVGIRNQAKMCGGIGRCGRELCCSAFMTKFEPVSIKMAKRQGLSLNPTKISGVCGRLMCCLTFENEIYYRQGRPVKNKNDTTNGEESSSK